jgi:hypothetical protein
MDYIKTKIGNRQNSTNVGKSWLNLAKNGKKLHKMAKDGKSQQELCTSWLKIATNG